MNLAAATVTVYFVGLVNFYNPRVTPPVREVIVPLASSLTSTYATLPLQPHAARIVIDGLDGATPKDDCELRLGGTWSSGICTVENVSGKKITLPASNDSLVIEDRFKAMPGLRTTLCKTMGEIKRDYMDQPSRYAARLKIDSGTLDVCRRGSAWVSKLTLTGSNGTFSLGAGSVTLKDNAVVQIVNLATPTGTELAHFSWHYKMYDTPIRCTNLPAPPPPSSAVEECPAIVTHFHRARDSASGVGCSVTQYP